MQQLFLLFIISVGFIHNSFAASFDCGKATQPQDKIVCATPALSAADTQLSALYKSALTTASDPTTLRKTQEVWLATRNTCADAACLLQAYQTRIAMLQKIPVITSANSVSTPAPTVTPATSSDAFIIPRNADGTYPVWVSPDLGVKSLSAQDIDAALERKFWDNPLYQRDFPGEISYLKDNQSQKNISTNCLDMVKLFQSKQLVDDGRSVSYTRDDTLKNTPTNLNDFLAEAWSYCQATRLLKHIQPAKISYVHDFILDKNLPSVMPAMLIPDDEPCIFSMVYSNLGGMYTSNSLVLPKYQKLSWESYYGFNNLDAANDENAYNSMKFLYTKPMESGMAFSTKDYDVDDKKATQTKLSLLAKGDFNGGGLESVLALNNVHRHEMNDQDVERKTIGLYLLTRKQAGNVFELQYYNNYLDKAEGTNNHIYCDAHFNKLLNNI